MSLAQQPTHGEGLEISEVADGLVVYQSSPEQVHYLNNTSAVIFELCQGDKTAVEIAAQVQSMFSLDEPPVAEVEACIADLLAKAVLQ
jgi:hypothetical protein